MSNNRQKLTWGAFGTMIFAIVIGLIGEYAEMALTGELPTPLPTIDYAAQLSDIQDMQLTSDAVFNQVRGITATPDTGQDPLQTLYESRLAALTPNADLLLTFCENTRADNTFNCVAWRDETITSHPAEIARCQAENGNFPACLTNAEIPLPGG
jgi:hypothetical protein